MTNSLLELSKTDAVSNLQFLQSKIHNLEVQLSAVKAAVIEAFQDQIAHLAQYDADTKAKFASLKAIEYKVLILEGYASQLKHSVLQLSLPPPRDIDKDELAAQICLDSHAISFAVSSLERQLEELLRLTWGVAIRGGVMPKPKSAITVHFGTIKAYDLLRDIKKLFRIFVWRYEPPGSGSSSSLIQHPLVGHI